jgi:hypothetical protein
MEVLVRMTGQPRNYLDFRLIVHTSHTSKSCPGVSAPVRSVRFSPACLLPGKEEGDLPLICQGQHARREGAASPLLQLPGPVEGNARPALQECSQRRPLTYARST